VGPWAVTVNSAKKFSTREVFLQHSSKGASFGFSRVFSWLNTKKTARSLHQKNGDICSFPRATLEIRACICFFTEVTFFLLSRNQERCFIKKKLPCVYSPNQQLLQPHSSLFEICFLRCPVFYLTWNFKGRFFYLLYSSMFMSIL
jgi:hypothetical protein